MFIKIKERINPLDVVSLAEARHQLNMLADETDDDDHIQTLITACSELAESYTNRLLSRSVVLILTEPDVDGGSFKLPFGETGADDILSVKDADGVDVEYTHNEISRVISISGDGPVIIEYNVGYENSEIPVIAKLGILNMVSTFFNHREDFIAGLTIAEVPVTSTGVLDGIRIDAIR